MTKYRCRYFVVSFGTAVLNANEYLRIKIKKTKCIKKIYADCNNSDVLALLRILESPFMKPNFRCSVRNGAQEAGQKNGGSTSPTVS
jgi:hypothetical protein